MCFPIRTQPDPSYVVSGVKWRVNDFWVFHYLRITCYILESSFRLRRIITGHFCREMLRPTAMTQRVPETNEIFPCPPLASSEAGEFHVRVKSGF